MADYIDRAELLELYSINEELEDAEKLQVPFMVVRQNIIDMPSADVQPVVHGKWIWDDEGYHCSECFFHAYGNTGEILSGEYHFCPNCGARMVEDE